MHLTINKKDFDYQWFSGTGAGGQHRNKHQNCFRLRHRATGITTTGQSYKSREMNKHEALKAMVKNPLFRAYCDRKLRELETGRTIEQRVEQSLRAENLKVEIKSSKGKWEVWNERVPGS